MNSKSYRLESFVGLAIAIGLVALAGVSLVQSEASGDTQMVLHRTATSLGRPGQESSGLIGDLDEAAGHDKKYVLVKKKPKHKKIKMEVFEPKMKYKKIKMKVPVKKMKKKKVKGYLVKKEHEHHHY